jgi:hypothetical protein
MATSKNTLLVAMNLPTAVPEFIIKAKAVLGSMLYAPYFEDSKKTLEELGTELVVLENSQKGLAQTPPLSTVVIRNASQDKARNLLRTLAGEVQTVANKNPEKAAEIIQSSGFDIKGKGGNTARKDEALDGTEEGVVIVNAATPGAHEWRISYDGGATFTSLAATKKSTTTMYNMEPGKKVWFQNRAMLAGNTYSQWTAWYWIIPKIYR